jgi:hypothetical protein
LRKGFARARAMRRVARPVLDFGPDALVVRFPGWAALAAAKRRARLPYAAIASAEVAPPRWPPWLLVLRVGTCVRGVFAAGTFVGRERRLLWFGGRDARVLTVRLRRGPSWYDEVSVAVDAPEAALRELRMRAGRGPLTA